MSSTLVLARCKPQARSHGRSVRTGVQQSCRRVLSCPAMSRPSRAVMFAVVLLASARPLASAPQESRIKAPGLHAPVSVVTDRWGIPHLRAASLDDLYFAWGWVSARDRLWQMVYTRQGIDGQLHRWLGNAALQADGGAQLFRLRERAHAIW